MNPTPRVPFPNAAVLLREETRGGFDGRRSEEIQRRRDAETSRQSERRSKIYLRGDLPRAISIMNDPGARARARASDASSRR